jgi:phosphatidylserine/phosphatidylglycerophosphate/cardiolipin synthase-like enzyme
MSDCPEVLIERIRIMARELPATVTRAVASTLARLNAAPAPAEEAAILARISPPHFRHSAALMFSVWRNAAPAVQPAAIALALEVASATQESWKLEQSLELVWTGPDTQVIPVRQTEQVLLEAIDATTRRLTVVSYAVYQIPRVCAAICRAIARKADVRVILEAADPDPSGGGYNNLLSIAPEVRDGAQFYHWPSSSRPKDPKGKPGILHVKCLVSDSRRLFLSSANLTEHAFTRNMELGILITGTELPGQVERHFDELIASRRLLRV